MKTVKNDNQPAMVEMATMTAMATATETVTPTTNTANGNIHGDNNAKENTGNIDPPSLSFSPTFIITIIVMGKLLLLLYYSGAACCCCCCASIKWRHQ